MDIRWNPRTGEQRTTRVVDATVITTSQGITDNTQELLHYEPDYKVLICQEHGYALQRLDSHLRDYHPITLKQRKAITRKYAQHELLEPTSVPLPPPLEAPFKALGKPVDAFLCEEEECGFVSISRSATAKHCNKSHDWK